MNPILTVTQQGQTRYIPGDSATPAQTTALAKIDPDAVVRQALDQQAAVVRDYLKGVGSAAQRTVDQAHQRNPTGYSSEPELRARNNRFYVTIVAMTLTIAAAVWGIVAIAANEGVIADAWLWPAWIAVTGAMAFLSIRWVHENESRRTPEGIALVTADSDAYATERAADGQHAIQTAIAAAIQWRAESEFADSQARQLATERAYTLMQPPQRQLTTTAPQEPGMVAFDTTLPVETPPSAAESPTRYRSVAMQPDAACLAMCAAVEALFDDCSQRGDTLIVSRLPWSQRGDWGAPMKRKAQDVLQQLDPPLLVAGDGGRWRLNVEAWHKAQASIAIRRRWLR